MVITNSYKIMGGCVGGGWIYLEFGIMVVKDYFSLSPFFSLCLDISNERIPLYEYGFA